MVVQLFATLREGRGKQVDIPWHEGLDGHTILKSLNLLPEDIKIFLINGRHSKPDAILKPDDLVALFPSVGGG
jgi:molybdopterin converting factor small subunit